MQRAPTDADAQHQLGLVLLYGGQPDRAEPLLAQAAAGGAPRARGDHARALVALGKVGDARTELEQHLRAYPDDAPIMVELARIMMRGGELKAAAALLESALRSDPELDDAEYALAECRGKSGDARAQWWHLGRAFELRGDLERAMNGYEKARDLAPEDSPERERIEEAMKELARATSPLGR